MLRYFQVSTTGYKALYRPIFIYLATPYNNRTKLFKFKVCANVGVLFSLDIPSQLARSTWKLYFLFSNFGFGVLHSYVMC